MEWSLDVFREDSGQEDEVSNWGLKKFAEEVRVRLHLLQTDFFKE